MFTFNVMYEHFDYKILYIFFPTKLNFDFKKLINDIINHTAFIYFFQRIDQEQTDLILFNRWCNNQHARFEYGR